MSAMNTPRRFGRFELRPIERQLLDGTTSLALGARAIDVLLALVALVARAGQLVTKDELLAAAWPGLVVEEANVHVQVSLLRKALGRDAIATVAGLGYRFALPLRDGVAAAAPHNLPADRTPFVGRTAALAVAAEICRRLDGIPLALELAAARLKLLSPQQLLDRLDERLRLLTGGQRAMPRQQTLLTVIQWSYENLAPEAQRLLRAMSVCGGCDLETAVALLGDGADDVAVLEPLSVLVDKGLVAVDRAAADMRYTSLETVRQYALQRLGECGEAGAVRDRHRDHFLAVAEQGEAAVRSHNPAASMDRMDRDRDNMLRALRRPEVPSVDGVRCLALSSLAQLCGWLGDMAASRRHAEAAYPMACELGDLRRMSVTVGQLGHIDAAQGDADTARRRIDEAMALARQAGAPDRVTWASS